MVLILCKFMWLEGKAFVLVPQTGTNVFVEKFVVIATSEADVKATGLCAHPCLLRISIDR